MRRASLARRPSSILLTSVALIAVMVAPVSAQPTSDEARSQLRQAQQRLDELEGEFNRVVDEYNEAQEQLDQARARVEEAKAELETLRRETDQLLAVTATHVRQLHIYGPTVEISTFFAAADASEAGAKAAALRRVLAGQQADLQSLTASRTSTQAAEQRLRDEEATAQTLTLQVEEKRDEIEATIDGQEGEVSRLETVLANAIEREEAERRAREAEERRRQAAARQRERERQQAQQASVQQASTSSTSTSSDSSPAPAPAPRANAQVAVDAALAQLGKPYRWGATGPNAFDCSGLMVYAWAQAGVSLPRTSHSQFSNLRRISRSELRPGDLVFAGSPRVHHVGMYIGNGQIVHAPRSGRPVEIRSMERSDLRGFGRVG